MKHGMQWITGLVAVALAAATAPAEEAGFVWKSEVPKDCPFEPSKTLTGVFFTGRHSDYYCGDTFYPSWASDGNLYSPWTDGKMDGGWCDSSDNLNWVSADQAYFARVTPSPETINDPKAYEFFAGHNAAGKPVWTHDFAAIKPLLE